MSHLSLRRLLFILGALWPLTGCPQEKLPQGYSPNTPESSEALQNSWDEAGAAFLEAKRKLIATGKIVIDRTQPAQPIDAGPPPTGWKATGASLKDGCGIRLNVPETAGYDGPDCSPNTGADLVSGLAASVHGDKRVFYGHAIHKLFTKGLKYDDHFQRVNFFIFENEGFEERLLKSGQIGANAQGLFTNSQFTPLSAGNAKAVKIFPVTAERTGSTQRVIARSAWSYSYRGKISYSTCIYSIHGNLHRAAEALTCFLDVSPTFYANPYVEEYLKVLASIQITP
jgi:hypothetical protein